METTAATVERNPTAPPRIPENIRRETVAATEKRSRKGRLRRAASPRHTSSTKQPTSTTGSNNSSETEQSREGTNSSSSRRNRGPSSPYAWLRGPVPSPPSFGRSRARRNAEASAIPAATTAAAAAAAATTNSTQQRHEGDSNIDECQHDHGRETTSTGRSNSNYSSSSENMMTSASTSTLKLSSSSESLSSGHGSGSPGQRNDRDRQSSGQSSSDEPRRSRSSSRSSSKVSSGSRDKNASDSPRERRKSVRPNGTGVTAVPSGEANVLNQTGSTPLQIPRPTKTGRRSHPHRGNSSSSCSSSNSITAGHTTSRSKTRPPSTPRRLLAMPVHGRGINRSHWFTTNNSHSSAMTGNSSNAARDNHNSSSSSSNGRNIVNGSQGGTNASPGSGAPSVPVPAAVSRKFKIAFLRACARLSDGSRGEAPGTNHPRDGAGSGSLVSKQLRSHGTGGIPTYRPSGVEVVHGGSAPLHAKDAKKRLDRLRELPGNSRCADCGGSCADWASIPHGSFVCLNCAEKHRSLGMLVTFSRSLTMDQWTETSLRRMEAGGNQRLSDFLSKVGVCAPSSIRDRYSHPFLLLYRSHIAALGEENESDTLSTEALRQAALDAGVGLPGSGNASDEGEDSENDDGDSSLRFRSLVRNVSDSCSGLGQAIRKCSMIGGGVDAPGVFVNGGGMRGDGEGGAPRWVPDEEQEACMLCAKK